MCVVQDLRVDKVIIERIWKVARIVNVMFIWKFKKAISCFQIEVFFFVSFFSVFPVCSLFLNRTFEQQGHINKVSDINKFVTMTSCPNQDMTPYWIFQKILKLFKLFSRSYFYLLVTCKINFASFRYFFFFTKLKLLWGVTELSV